MDDGDRQASPDESKTERRIRSMNEHMREVSKPGATAGITFGLFVVITTMLGYWLDGLVATKPWLMIGGLAFGSVFGFIWLVETVTPGTLFKKRRSDAKD